MKFMLNWLHRVLYYCLVVGLWDLVSTLFLDLLEVENLREYHTDLREKTWVQNSHPHLVIFKYCYVFFPRFLDILAARKDPSGLSGEVLVDRAPQPPNFKCLSGYVVQVSSINYLVITAYLHIQQHYLSFTVSFMSDNHSLCSISWHKYQVV